MIRGAALFEATQAMKNPDMAKLISETLCKMISGYWPIWFINIFTQNYWRDGPYNLGDAYAFIQIYSEICEGRLSIIIIHTNYLAYSDDQIDATNEILSKLPKPFSGEFWGSIADDDGVIKWNERIKIGQYNWDNQQYQDYFLNPSEARLEMGTTAIDTTLFHLFQWPNLVRWPYGSKDMYLLHRQWKEDNHWNAGKN